MYRLLLFIFSLISSIAYSQTHILVLDGLDDGDSPLENVVIYDENDILLGKTNKDGVFITSKNTKTVRLHLDGYEIEKLFLYGKDITVRLYPVTVQLETTQITDTDAEERKNIKQMNKIKKNKNYSREYTRIRNRKIIFIRKGHNSSPISCHRTIGNHTNHRYRR